MANTHLCLGSHLFPTEYLNNHNITNILMCESLDLVQHYKYHKLKVHFFLTSMRQYAKQLENKWNVHYYTLEQTAEKEMGFFDCLSAHCQQHHITSLSCFFPEDRFFRKQLESWSDRFNIDIELLPSPLFLNTPQDFKRYLDSTKKPFLKHYYEEYRKKTGILMEQGKPVGGQWSFDNENRKKLPKDIKIPEYTMPQETKIHHEVRAVIERFCQDHPGRLEYQWYATTTDQARQQFRTFLDTKFSNFGAYQDALCVENPFLFHSLLSPYINTGLLPVQEVLDNTLRYASTHDIPLNSLEGFIRQIIGWREFIYGIDYHFGEEQANANFFGHRRKLGQSWYTGNTDLLPLDTCIKKALKYGYNHHIERLMIVGNLMLLCEIHPKEAYTWFMEMFIDSADWVMGPNVYGMSLFSDGGLFATKPYICGSNYLLKMGRFPEGNWQATMDGLYWRFIDKHLDFFKSQPRLSMMARQLEKMKPDRREHIFTAAEHFLEHNTIQANT